MKYDPNFPKRWTRELAYLFGLMLGDGSLPVISSRRPNGKYQNRYHVYLASNSLDFIKEVCIPIFERIFGLTPWIENRKGKTLCICRIESKSLYEGFQNLGFKAGRKAKIADVPKLPKKYRKHLLAGLLDADGGKKGNGFGLSTSSEKLANFCMDVFRENNFKFNSCPWNYKGHQYHQVYLPKTEIHKILKRIPLRNKDKLEFLRENANVAQ